MAFAIQLQAVSPAIALPGPLAENPDPMNHAPIAPFLLHGETTQGFMSVEYREARVVREIFRGRSIEALELEELLSVDVFVDGDHALTRLTGHPTASA